VDNIASRNSVVSAAHRLGIEIQTAKEEGRYRIWRK